MSEPEQARSPNTSTQRAIGWAGVVLAVIAVLGLLSLPGAWFVWIAMLVFAAASIPQALFAGRFEQRKGAGRRRG